MLVDLEGRIRPYGKQTDLRSELRSDEPDDILVNLSH